MKKNKENQSKEKLFEIFDKLNSTPINESTSYLINNGMIKRALNASNLMAYKDEITDFDIAEAIAVYIHDYNDNTNIINQFKGLLRISKFNPSPSFTYKYEDLDEIAKMVYDAIVDFYENENINELNASTYSRVMNNTSEYPWDYFFSKNPDKAINPKELGTQKGRINKLAQELFIKEFYKEFPIGGITINTSEGEYIFIGIKFEANYTRYDAFFKEKSNYENYTGRTIWITPSGNDFYINISRGLTITDPESINKVKDILKYNKR